MFDKWTDRWQCLAELFELVKQRDLRKEAE